MTQSDDLECSHWVWMTRVAGPPTYGGKSLSVLDWRKAESWLWVGRERVWSTGAVLLQS